MSIKMFSIGFKKIRKVCFSLHPKTSDCAGKLELPSFCRTNYPAPTGGSECVQ